MSLYVVSVVAAYWVVSISMVYLNKILLSSSDTSIAAPLFVTWYQCVLTCVICWVLGILGERDRQAGATKTFLADFPLIRYRLPVSLSVLPLSAVFVAMVAFNNICLQYVQVSFYNVARCLSLVFNVLFTFFLLKQTTSWRTCSTLLVVLIGFALGVDGEIDFSLIGTTAGVLASAFVSLNSVLTSKMLSYVEGDKSLLLFYNNLNATFLFLPLIFFFERDILIASSSTAMLISGWFWVCMTIAGVMGFAIGLVTVLQVKATSPLTHNISGIAKSAVQSFMAFYIWGNQATTKGVLGIWLVLFGTGLYTYVQMTTPSSAATSLAASSAVGQSKKMNV
eukprot:gene10207-11296_t